MRPINPRAKGYATEAAARAKFARAAGLIPNSTALVVVREDGKFIPVVVIHADDMWNARALCDAGVYVTN
jgi:hypothetical protein